LTLSHNLCRHVQRATLCTHYLPEFPFTGLSYRICVLLTVCLCQNGSKCSHCLSSSNEGARSSSTSVVVQWRDRSTVAWTMSISELPGTGCRSLVVVLSLSIREVVSSSPVRAGRVKPKTFNIGSDCFFAKSTAFRSENHGSFGYDLKNGGPVSQYVWHVKKPHC
jgi:hypothetical protein